jgi:three-Cys-motif partner protein
MAKKVVRTTLIEHALVKSNVYLTYLKKYLNITARERRFQTLYLGDVFCGNAHLQGIQGVHYGTLDLLKNIDIQSDTLKIQLLWNDSDAEKIASLKAHLTPSLAHVHFTSYPFEAYLQDLKYLLYQQSNARCTLLIDLYDAKPLNIIELKHLLTSPKIDILFFLPISLMYQFVSKPAETELLDSDKSVSLDLFEHIDLYASRKRVRDAAFEPLKQLMYALFGKNLPIFQSLQDFIQKLEAQIKYYFDVQVDVFQWRSATEQQYAFFFLTSNLQNFEKMLETKWELDLQTGTNFYLGDYPNVFAKMEGTGYENLLQLYLIETRRYNGDIYNFSLQHKFLPTHSTQILKKWQQEGQLEVFLNPNSKARRESFYVNNHEKPKKVFFNLLS